MKPTRFFCFILMGLSLNLSACDQVNSYLPKALQMTPDNTIPDHVTLKIGESGADFVERNKHFLHQNIQPMGMKFYKINAHYQKKLITIRLELGKNSVEIPYTLSSMSSDEGDPRFGITSIDLSMAANNYLVEGDPSHDDVRRYVLGLLATFKAAGWKRYIPNSAARIRGASSFKYFREVDSYTGLDPDYALTTKEWMALDNDPILWKLYAGDVFVTIGFMREDTQGKLKPHERGAAYLLGVNFEGAEFRYYNNSYLGIEGSYHWRSVWLEKALKDRKDRNEAEKAAIEAGYEIDTRYEDMPLPPAPPGQTNPVLPKELTFMPATHLYSLNPNAVALGKMCKTGDICPESGMWHFFGPAITRDDMYAFLPSDAQKRDFKAGDIFPTVSMGYKTRNPIKKWIKGDIHHVDAPAHWVLKAYT